MAVLCYWKITYRISTVSYTIRPFSPWAVKTTWITWFAFTSFFIKVWLTIRRNISYTFTRIKPTTITVYWYHIRICNTTTICFASVRNGAYWEISTWIRYAWIFFATPCPNIGVTNKPRFTFALTIACEICMFVRTWNFTLVINLTWNPNCIVLIIRW